MRDKHTLSLEHGLYEDLRKLSVATRINISRLLDEALEDLLEKYDVDELWKVHLEKLEEKEKKKNDKKAPKI